MKNKFKFVTQRKNRNFFGDFSLFKEEMEQKIFNTFSEDGCFWIYKTQEIYHIKYAVNNYETLTKLLSEHFDQFKRFSCLLEINYYSTLNENFSDIKMQLENLTFTIEDHHIAYVKNYFRDKRNSSNKIRLLSQNNLSDILQLLTETSNVLNSLPKESVQELLYSANNAFFGYYEENNLLGLVLFSLSENIEKIGFIRELVISDKKNIEEISNELLNYSLNYFSIHGFSKAFYWGDVKDNGTINKFLRYGFKLSNQQVIVFSKE